MQPFLVTPRVGNASGASQWGGGGAGAGSLSARMAPPGEPSYSLSTIRRMHAVVLQAGVRMLVYDDVTYVYDDVTYDIGRCAHVSRPFLPDE
jgi:hypothetical protein